MRVKLLDRRFGWLPVLLVLLGASIGFAASAFGQDEFQVKIGSGLQPRMTASEASDVAKNLIALMGQKATNAVATDIETVTAVVGSEVASIEPSAAIDPSGAGSIVWVVRARGTFISERGPNPEPITASSGYILVDDASGTTIGMGFP